MKNKFGRTAVGTFLALIALLGSLSISASAQENADGDAKESNGRAERTIQGVWRAMVTARDCQSGTQLAPAFNDLLAFHSGGTMSEDGAGPGQSPALRGSGLGLWERSSGVRRYAVAFTFNTYNASGAYDGFQRVTGDLRLGATGSTLTGNAAVYIFDVNNNQVFAGCATVTGTRFN